MGHLHQVTSNNLKTWCN